MRQGTLHNSVGDTDDAPEPEETSDQPEVPSAAEGEALRVEREQYRVTPNLN